MTVPTELTRREENTRTLTVDLKGLLKLDSDGVNYNLWGVVIFKEIVGIQKVGGSQLVLSPDVEISPMLITASNTDRQCIKLMNKKVGKSMLFGIRDIEKIEVTETRRFTLVT